MLLVHTSPSPAMNNYFRLLVTSRREDYTGAAPIYANTVQVSLFMSHIESVYEYSFSVPPDSVPLFSEISLRPRYPYVLLSLIVYSVLGFRLP